MPLVLAAFLACVAPEVDRPRPLLDTDGETATAAPMFTSGPGHFAIPERADPRLEPLPEPAPPACPGSGLWAFEEVGACAAIEPLHILPPITDPLRTDLVTAQAFADFDGDTWLDVLIGLPAQDPLLFLGSSTGEFTDGALSLPGVRALSASVADYDHDGDPDAFLGGVTDRLLRNDGGVLVDSGEVLGAPRTTYGGSWSDGDLDGDLELLIVDYECPTCEPEATACELRGDGLWEPDNGVWVNRSDWLFGATQLECGMGFAAAWGDLDNDGDVDLYIANDRGAEALEDNPGQQVSRNTYWVNDQPCSEGHCFSEVARENGTAGFMDGMGIDLGDYDNDGDLDIAVTDMASVRIYDNDGTGVFTEVTEQVLAGPLNAWDAWGVLWLDYDNDGDLDLFSARTQETALHRNDGGVFTNVAPTDLPAIDAEVRGAALADYDRDGRLDVLIGCPGNRYRLLRNTTDTANNWVGLRLLGDGPGGRDALGARVWVTDTSGRVQLREVKSGHSNGAGSDLGVHVGLGTETLDEVRIVWPDGFEETVEVWENRWTAVDRLR